MKIQTNNYYLLFNYDSDRWWVGRWNGIYHDPYWAGPFPSLEAAEHSKSQYESKNEN